MKKLILILIISMEITVYLTAQSAGDYRSVGVGNWNDPAKWELFNGSSWANSTTYPGQHAGTGTVTIMDWSEIIITESVPHPVANLSVNANYPDVVIDYECEFQFVLPSGVLKFNGEDAITLKVSGNVAITGQLKIENANGAKSHELFIGGSLNVGAEVYVANCDTYVVQGNLQTINLDDKLGVTFNTTDPNSSINRSNGISFHDITFNGTGTIVNCHMGITGNANFINGIVKLGAFGSGITFSDGSTVSGGSNLSFIQGTVQKFGDDPFTFPIGDDGVYAPLTISTPARLESFWANYKRNNNGFFEIITDTGLHSISKCERWQLENEGNYYFTYPFDVTVGWTSANRCVPLSNITNVSNITLAQLNGISYSNTWDSHGGTGVGAIDNGSVTYRGLTRVGLFTLGNIGTSCGTPSGLTATNITTNSATVSWSAVTGAVTYDVDYRAQHASWINAVTGTALTSVNLPGLSGPGIYEWKVRANCGTASSVYRQTQFTTIQNSPAPVCNDIYETNNSSSQAKTIGLGITIPAIISSAADVDWFKISTPNTNYTSLEVKLTNLPADYDLYLYNKTLKLIGVSAATGTSGEMVIHYSNARKAVYYIKVVAKNGAYNTSQCYNLLAQVTGGASSASSKSYPANEVTDISDKQLLYPNPASEFVMMHFNSIEEGQVNVQIFNAAGQLVKQSVIKITKGYNQVKIAVNDIKQGMYLLRINKGELNMLRKFVIAR